MDNDINKTHIDDKKQPKTTLLQDIISLLIKIAAIAIAFVLILSFVFGAFRYGDLSMKPNVKDGDMVLSYRWDKRYAANDVIAFSYNDEMTCSRVIAVEGDEVDIKSSGLLVNGNHVQEDYAIGETTQVKDGITFPLTVPAGNVFVLGDNRKLAVDSRIFGCVDIEKTQGKVIGVFRHRGI